MAFKPRPINITGKHHDDGTEKARFRVMLATPAYDGNFIQDYAISLSESSQTAPMFGIHVTTTLLQNGAFIDLARNRLVQMFLESDCTHLFFIDADLRWEARAFVGLVTADLPICAGVYPKRQNPEEYPARWAKDPVAGEGVWVSADGSMDHDKIADAGWIMCERVPTGFLCIRRDTVEYMVARSPRQKMMPDGLQPVLFAATHFIRDAEDSQKFHPIDLINGDFTPDINVDFIGEDFYFSDRYRKMTGKMIPAWPDFDFTHGKQWTGNWHNFLVKQGDENEEMQKAGLISDAMAQKEADAMGVRHFDLRKVMTDDVRKLTMDQFRTNVLAPLKAAA